MAPITAQGFIVHAYADPRRNRVHVLGRLTDGRSFAVIQPFPDKNIAIRERDKVRASEMIEKKGVQVAFAHGEFESFDGNPCVMLTPANTRNADALVRLLRNGGVEVFGDDIKGAAALLIKKGIRSGVGIEGDCRAGKGVDLIFPQAELTPRHEIRAPLSVLSIDIETDETNLSVRAIALVQSVCGCEANFRQKIILFAGVWKDVEPPDSNIRVFPDERGLLEDLVLCVRELDPDIITGWNIIDFDFLRLAHSFERYHLPFVLGRSLEGGRFFPSETQLLDGEVSVKRSASVFLPGRQVLDGLRLVRTGFQSYESYALDAVARVVLGRGKNAVSGVTDKLSELDRLYNEHPLTFCRYCLNDAELVLDILEKKNLINHTIERAAMTGAGIDKAWTSVASFERVYAEGLYKRGIFEPLLERTRVVSGAAGGTVLDPMAGIFDRIAVFDFRSLYPSIIRTFNIDPLAFERALGRRGPEFEKSQIRAPNGAVFERGVGILPLLIADYFQERLEAIARGDEASAYVYKILMNSFYGVLGTPTCRYARTELAGAITSFGKYCLHFARDFFVSGGYRVLYGDTDSVFVQLPEKGLPADYLEMCTALADQLNDSLDAHIRETYEVPSFIGIRFEKIYRRFYIPRLRTSGPSDGSDSEPGRGRAKGYAGLLVHADGSTEVEIKGMEAARSDYTPLARRFQRELLGHLFREDSTTAAEEYIRDQTLRLYQGELDDELVFRKKIRRAPDSYTASTPPHIKVARALGWTNRGGTVEYLITVNGPEALSLLRSPIDYPWYALSQLLPAARSAGLEAGFDADEIILGVPKNGQLEFEWKP